MSRAWPFVVPMVLAVSLLGCGDDDGDESSESDAGTGSASSAPADSGDTPDGSVFEGELEDGSTIRVTLDVPADDEAVAPFEAFRSLTGGPEVTWIVAEVEVPEGTDGTGRFVSFIEPGADPMADDPMDDADGVTNAEFACSMLDEWYGLASSPGDDVVAAYDELLTDSCGGQTLQVLAPGGETTRYVMVYDGELPEFEAVTAGLANELEPA